ncbi:MAG: GNAT family N-acetyltransferase [bacterium]|nr:GNAT family N-acetyltransferase [bacterium]
MKKIFEQKGEQFRLLSKVGELWGWRLISSDLSAEEKAIIFQHSYQVGMNAFSQKHSAEMEYDVYSHLFNNDQLFIVVNEKLSVSAFLTSRDIDFGGKKILYISRVCVDPLRQGYGISRKLIEEAYKRGEHYDAMALKTQNPVMKECFDKCIGGKSYPDNGAKPPREVEEAGIFLANLLKAEKYHTQSLIIKGAYGKCLYGVELSSRDEAYNDQFNKLDKSAGDSMLCIKMLA